MPSPPSESASQTRRPRHSESLENSGPNGTQSAWISRQVQAMASAWSRGQRVTAEELLAGHPGIGDEAAIRLIYEEVCLRRDSGQEIATTEVVNRFPRWRDELEVLLGCDRMLRPFSRVAKFPGTGEDLGPFRLLAELGRGASGKTYLAAEPALGDRLVVLKVITDDQEEHLSLARLQHTHIIPLFSEQSFPERGLRALCMPYLGGASLARVLEQIAGIPPAERRGRDLIEVLDRMRAMHADASMVEGPYRRYLEQATYVQAICWIGACLADALQSAHAHGLVHMDVKPSNVLIAGDGLPMLLDFHLAHRPVAAGERVADRLGGTPGWMAPEHREALDAVGQGEALARPLDGRADVYALGLLLREALNGPGAVEGRGGSGTLRSRNHDVSTGLSDIIERCLAARPADRYHDAAALAEDLRRHLNDLPLRGVANRSLLENWRKWRRRRPAALTRWTARIATGTALIAVLVLAQAFHGQRVGEMESALREGRRLRGERRFPEAAEALRRGLELGRNVPGVGSLKRSLWDQLLMARRGQKAAALHALADLVRFRYGVELPAAEEARALVGNIQAVWDERDLLLAPSSGSLDAKSEQVIRADLLDLAIVAAELRVGLASPEEAEAVKRAAVRLLDDASAACGPSPRLSRLRHELGGEVGPGGPVAGSAPGAFSVSDHYDLGRSYLRSARFREAAVEFERVIDQRPQDFWPHFYRGHCAYRLGRFQEAHGAFQTCVALYPATAECYYNRARVAEALGRGEQAARDYSRALELDPTLAPAALNRGILAYKAGRHDQAIADFGRALRTTTDSKAIGSIHFNLALAYLGRGDRATALTSVHDAIARGNDDARGLLGRLKGPP